MLRTPRHRGGAAVAVVLVIGIVAGLVALAWGFGKIGGGVQDSSANASAGEDPQWHVVTRRSFEVTVTANGELDARNKLYVKNEVEGKTTIIDIVDEGTRVSKDDVLVRLADDELKKQIQDTEELVQKADADKKATEQDLAIERSEAESAKRAEEVKLALAELSLSEWREGTVKKKQLELNLAVVKAQDNLKIARRNAEESKKLFDAKFISEGEYDDDQLKLKEAISAEETAKVNLEAYSQYTLKQEQKKFESDVTEAMAALERAIRKNASKIARATATFEAAANTLETRQEKLAKLKQQLAACTMRAPGDGIVVYATSIGSNRYRRSEPIGKNRDVLFNENLIVLPDPSHMVAILKVNESRMPDIEIGQKVVVNIDAMRGRPIEGVVWQKATMADETSFWNPDVRTYEVRVDLPALVQPPPTQVTAVAAGVPDASDKSAPGGKSEDPRSPRGKNGRGKKKDGGTDAPPVVALNPGMRCSGQISIEQVDNVIAVPVHAVFSEGRERFAYVAGEQGLFRKQSVQIGKSNETYVEIRQGLSEGDRVLLRRPSGGEVQPEKDGAKKGPKSVEESNGKPDASGKPSRPQAAPATGQPRGSGGKAI